MPVLDLTFDLGASLIQNVEKVLGELVLEGQIVLATVLVGEMLPLFEPFIQSVANQNAVAHSRESLLPGSILGALHRRKTKRSVRILIRRLCYEQQQQ